MSAGHRTSAALAIVAIGALLSGCSSPAEESGDAGPLPVDTGAPDAAEPDAGVDSGPPPDAGPRPDVGPPPPPLSEPGLHDVEIVDTRRIVPSSGLPPETIPDHSNNNLDVIRHGGRVILAWRTSPDHYAGPETIIYVVSSTDEVNWTYEATFTIGTDLREPRFLEVDGALFLYLAVLGTERLDFNPMGTRVTQRMVDGTGGVTWSPLENVAGLERHIVWRTRTIAGVHYMMAYSGGEMIYDFLENPMLEVDLLTTTDGRAWVPYDTNHPHVYVGGGSESDFALGDDGTLYGVIRLEAGDATGFGSKVCTAPPGDLDSWTCTTDPRKYDSPLMFWHDGEAYLVGRRNVTADGNYDLMHGVNHIVRQVNNQLAYRDAPKRCSIWRFVQGENRIAYITDLPSNGDTCFASVIETGAPGELAIYNYSSDVDGPAVGWGVGQDGDTFIYRHLVRFTRR